MGKILNKVKEKTKAIKSEISEISKLIASNSELDDNNVDDLQNGKRYHHSD